MAFRDAGGHLFLTQPGSQPVDFGPSSSFGQRGGRNFVLWQNGEWLEASEGSLFRLDAGFPPGYPRPAGATPLRVSLVTAYDECTAPNRTHGPPLDSDSCNPPTRTSEHLTVGTADSNGQVVRYEGHVRLNTIVGNPSTPADEADVAIDFFSKGVLTNALANYTGELRAEVPLRITDKDNTPNPAGCRHYAELHIRRRCHLRDRPRPLTALGMPDHHDRRCPDPRSDQGGPALDLAAGSGGGLRRRARRRHRHRGQHGLRAAGALRSVGSAPCAESCEETAQDPLVHSAVTGAGADACSRRLLFRPLLTSFRTSDRSGGRRHERRVPCELSTR